MTSPPHQSFTLANGLQLIIQPIPNSNTIVMNTLYHVGSVNDPPTQTGLAHLFEHIMFGGSAHIHSYDKTLEKVGGTNNAYTTPDITNYWCKLPTNKLEVACWLESDRMISPAYRDQTIETQRQVVIEEYKQTCLNKPYGDAWHHILSQAYKIHPYRWPTIGKEINHIKKITKQQIITFGNHYYRPDNAIITIVGNITPHHPHQLVKKWFSTIPTPPPQPKPTPTPEPPQTTPQHTTITRKVAQNALYKTYHIPKRTHPQYPAIKLLSNILTAGHASLLHKNLIEKQAIFTQIESYTTESIHPGLLVIEGKLQDHITLPQAEKALNNQLQHIIDHPLKPHLIAKAQNQEISEHLFSQNHAQQAEQLALGTLLGNSHFFTQEITHLQQVTPTTLQATATHILQQSNSHTLYYQKVR